MIIQKNNKLINVDNEELHLKKRISLTKKKKRRMRIFEHRFFPKSFGGKIRHIWTEVTYRINKEHASKDLVFFGGKISCWTAFIINNNFPALDFGVWILAS